MRPWKWTSSAAELRITYEHDNDDSSWNAHADSRRRLGERGYRCAVSTSCWNTILRMTHQPKLGWTEHLRLKRELGHGGQGVVYLSERRGSDNFTLPVALKFFSPERFADERSYREAMERMAQVSSRVALIQHDNLLDVQNFIERRRIRMLEMEWVDGYDLDALLAPAMLERARAACRAAAGTTSISVIATAGHGRTRLKPGMAVAIVRECLAGIAALHREEIVHGDIKPSNIMVKRTGNAKIIDIGSAIEPATTCRSRRRARRNTRRRRCSTARK